MTEHDGVNPQDCACPGCTAFDARLLALAESRLSARVPGARMFTLEECAAEWGVDL